MLTGFCMKSVSCHQMKKGGKSVRVWRQMRGNLFP